MKICESDLLISALSDFTNFHNNKGIVVLDVIEMPLTRKCFVYLLWMYMSLKFKHFAVPELIDHLRSKFNFHYRKL